MNLKDYKKSQINKEIPYGIFALLLFLILAGITAAMSIFIIGKEITKQEYYIIAGVEILLSFMFGAVWIASRKSWDIQTFTSRLRNIDDCDHLIHRAKRMKNILIESGEKSSADIINEAKK